MSRLCYKLFAFRCSRVDGSSFLAINRDPVDDDAEHDGTDLIFRHLEDGIDDPIGEASPVRVG